MKIEILLYGEDLRRLAADHCRKVFKINPKNVDVTYEEPKQGGKNQYYIRIEGDYSPEV